MASSILGRIKNVRTYKPNIYVYKCIYEPIGTTVSTTGTSQNLADVLSNLWRLYIDQVLGLSNTNYTVYTLVSIPTLTMTTPAINRYHLISYTYLIFEHGILIPSFSSGGLKPLYGLNNIGYTPVYESMQINPNAPNTNITTASSYYVYPMPLKIFGNYDIMNQLNTNNISLKSVIPLVELYGALDIKGSGVFLNTLDWISGYRFTFEQLDIQSYSFGVQFVMENMMQWPGGDNAGISNAGAISTSSKNFYQNIITTNSNPINPNDNAETTVIVNEILSNPKAINLKVLMLQSPQLFIKYGEYLLLVYRYAITHSLGPINPN